MGKNVPHNDQPPIPNIYSSSTPMTWCISAVYIPDRSSINTSVVMAVCGMKMHLQFFVLQRSFVRMGLGDEIWKCCIPLWCYPRSLLTYHRTSSIDALPRATANGCSLMARHGVRLWRVWTMMYWWNCTWLKHVAQKGDIQKLQLQVHMISIVPGRSS